MSYMIRRCRSAGAAHVTVSQARIFFMKLPELPTVLKMRVVLKTLAVQACLLVGILVVVWGL